MSKSSQDDHAQITRIISKPDQSDALRVRRARLKVVKGPDKGLTENIEHPGLVVGTSPECDLVLNDPAVSRRHLELAPTDDGFCLRDMNSKNGTTVSGLKIRDVLVSEGVDIQLGKSVLRLIVLDEHDEYPLSPRTSFGPLLGRSVAMRRIFAALEPTAASDSILLLEGESGTGKDVAAETVHQFSKRRDEPLIIVDCGAIQPSLAESELFGHRKGTFTGAERDRTGAIESADKGTVFLDEIGELGPDIQPKLLRFLEKKEIKLLGENHYRSVDVRLIAATNRDLKAEVAAGRFREDLFYRLSVVKIRIPPLRDRREDIGLLARSFVQKLDPELDPVEVISEQVISMFLSHDWPGNVRELRNVVERLLLFPNRPEAALALTPARQDNALSNLMSLPFHDARRQWTEQFEKMYLSATLDSCNRVISNAAKAAGIPRQTFHRLMAKHGLKK